MVSLHESAILSAGMILCHGIKRYALHPIAGVNGTAQFEKLSRQTTVLLSILMILSGLTLLVGSIILLPAQADVFEESSTLSPLSPYATQAAAEFGIREPDEESSTLSSLVPLGSLSPLAMPFSPLPTDVPRRPVTVQLEPGVPRSLSEALLQTATLPFGVKITRQAPADIVSHGASSDVILHLEANRENSVAIYQQLFAASTRFDTLWQELSFAEMQALWQEAEPQVDEQAAGSLQSVIVLTRTLPALEILLGPAGPTVTTVQTVDMLIERAWRDETTLALLPFDLLTPELAPLAVDGQNPTENNAGFQVSAYPLIVTTYLSDLRDDSETAELQEFLRAQTGECTESSQQVCNRDPGKLTLLVMTGVTAMVRETAYKMDTYGPTWVAEDIGPQLRAADITHVSNEVPFVAGCETNRTLNNLVFCSSPAYMAALEAIGTDIVGLTGNHQNDYGPENALKSLDIYAEAGLPVYGGGRNKAEAFAPLYLEHNGTRFAFLGANSYGPDFAWAADDMPGSAQFNINILSATIRSIHEKDLADVVLVELQYQETYDVTPLWVQRQDFRSLIQAGADIVTGVQSHVAQAIEFEEKRPILYGLGNLFFDQMWEDATRDGLVVKHTFYDGRHIATRLLPTILHDFGQPRWARDGDRERILRHVLDASYWERPTQ